MQVWIVYAVASSISLPLGSEDTQDNPDQQVAAAADWQVPGMRPALVMSRIWTQCGNTGSVRRGSFSGAFLIVPDGEGIPPALP